MGEDLAGRLAYTCRHAVTLHPRRRTYLADRRVAPHQRLSFVPAMMFFTMGFKDILAALRDPADASPLQASVHRHCDEDALLPGS